MRGVSIHSYEWHDGKLYLHVNSGFMEATLSEAAEQLSRQELACLSAKRAWKVQLCENETTIIGVKSDDDAEWCQDMMKGYRVGTCIKWSESASGGSMFFHRVLYGG